MPDFRASMAASILTTNRVGTIPAPINTSLSPQPTTSIQNVLLGHTAPLSVILFEYAARRKMSLRQRQHAGQHTQHASRMGIRALEQETGGKFSPTDTLNHHSPGRKNAKHIIKKTSQKVRQGAQKRRGDIIRRRSKNKDRTKG